jgi:hypothetical protein
MEEAIESAGFAAQTDGVSPSDVGVQPVDAQPETPVASEGAEGTPKDQSDEHVPKRDLDRLRSAKDKEIAQINQAYMDAMRFIEQLQSRVDELELAGADPAIVEQRKTQRQIEAERARIAMAQQALEPVARDIVLTRLAQQYGVPREALDGFTNPRDAENAAKLLAQARRAKVLEERKAKGTDHQEGGTPTSSANSVKNNFDVMDLLTQGYRKR